MYYIPQRDSVGEKFLETSLKIQRLEELSLAAKENVSSLKKKIDDDEHGLTNFKQRLSGLNNEGQGWFQKVFQKAFCFKLKIFWLVFKCISNPNDFLG